MRRPLLAALAALVIPVPGALAGGVPGPQLQFTGPLNLTTPADVQAQANELTGKRSPAPMAAQPPPPPQEAAGAPGCGASGDVMQLLSPACVEALRTLQPHAGAPWPAAAAQPPASAGPQGVPCAIAIFADPDDQGKARPGGMSSMVAPSLERCIEAGARLSFGIPGLTNITAIDPAYGVVAVACRRFGPDGHRISCTPQPVTQGADADPGKPAADSPEAAGGPDGAPPVVKVGQAPPAKPAQPAPAANPAAKGTPSGPAADIPAAPVPLPAQAAPAGAAPPEAARDGHAAAPASAASASTALPPEAEGKDSRSPVPASAAGAAGGPPAARDAASGPPTAAHAAGAKQPGARRKAPQQQPHQQALPTDG